MQESVESQRKQEVLIERLANYESSTKGSFDRIHARVDKLEQGYNLKIAECDVVKLKADNGDKAYRGLMWILGTLGILALGTIYTRVWGV